MREWLPRLSFDRPVSVLMMLLAMLVVGAIAYGRISVQMMPSGFEPGFLYVWVPYSNASPTEVDEQIVRPIEDQLGTVPGIESMSSYASSGSAGFPIRFYSTIDMDEAYNTVVDRLERAMVELPDDVERYGIYRYNPSDEPVIWAGVQLGADMEDPHHVMTNVVQPRLERIPGVATLDVWGVPQRAVWIDFDKERVYSHGVNLGEVQGRLRSDNFQMASGSVEERGAVRHVRALSKVEGVEDLKFFPVKDGVVLRDIADVKMRGALSSDLNRVNAQDAAGIAIRMESSANAVEVSDAVKAAFAELERDPRVEGAKFFVFFSQGDLIADAVSTLTQTALTGGLFAVVILFAFLREWRMTLLIAASIPFSLLITVGVLYFTGGSLNLLTLMGLMLATGMVVDNAIVVVETIYRRRGEGQAPRDAAIWGTGEVGVAILLSTATTMAVFLPVILMDGGSQLSFFLGKLGMPVVWALAASLLVALVFAPLATRFVGGAEVKEDPRWLKAISRWYQRFLGAVTRQKSNTALGLFLAIAATMYIAFPGLKGSDGVDENLNDFVIRFSVPPSANIYERDDILRAFEQTVEDHREEWGVRVHRAQLRSGRNEGRIFVYILPDGPMDRVDVMKAATKALPDDMPGVKALVGWEARADSGGGPRTIALEVTGENMEVLSGLAEEIERRVKHVDGVLTAHLDLENEGADEIRLHVDRDAASRYGVSAQQIGSTVGWAMRGGEISKIRTGEKEVPIVSRFSLEDRSGLHKLLDFDVWSNTLQRLISIGTVTETEFGKGPGRIRRRNRITSTSVTLDLVDGKQPSDVMPLVQAAMADMVFPRGYGWNAGDRDRKAELEDDATSLALLLSVCFVFLLIGILLESWVLPMVIITTIPMAMFGSIWGLYLTGTPMDVMATVGMIVLVGVVVNNGIVLVDRIHQLRLEGVSREEALLAAGERRLRPILMTAMTTICGLLPMALGTSNFVGIPYAPLGRTVIGGLIASTVLTLLFIPWLYAVLDDLREATWNWVGAVLDR